MRTLVTGFGAFGTVASNPSARIVARLEQAGAAGHALSTRVLPVSYERSAREIDALLRAGTFDAAVMLGVARSAQGLRVERVARLRMRVQKPDVDGQAPPVVEGNGSEREVLATTFPVEAVVARLLGSGFEARVSEDAGDYVCNHAYYAALRTIQEAGLSTRCLFLHVPPDEETFDVRAPGAGMPLDRQVGAVAEVLAWLSGPGEP
jgi:pyroglutamyl-peptidase